MTMKLVRKRAAARIDAVAEAAVSDAHLALINRLVPEGFPRLTAADVHVRSALVCNDQVDHYSTRFTPEALAQIAALVNSDDDGVNVMRNHNEYGSEDLPVARIFSCEQVNVSGVNWCRMWFYWPRGTDDGDCMARNIDSGLWREVSISWWMSSFVNSIDGQPFDESPYYPGQKLPDGSVVIGIMSGIEEINEVSFVSRGGQKNTAIMPARGAADPDERDVEGLILAARGRVMARTNTQSESALGLEHLFGNGTPVEQHWYMSDSG